MKLAYLILAHNNFQHLDRLLQALNNDEDEIFLHIDKGADLPQIKGIRNLTFINRRIKVRWACFSVVKASNELLKQAYSNSNAEYFILLSGCDYPIKPPIHLKRFLERKGEYINLLQGNNLSKPIERYNQFYLGYDRRVQSPKTKLYRFIEGLMRAFKTEKKIPFDLCTGSQWFALSRAAVAYILKTITTEKKYNRFFRNTYCPDEAYYQTIIGNSPFLKEVKTNLTYTDWTKSEKPAYIDQSHIKFLQRNYTYNTEYGEVTPFFARKFRDASVEVVEKINREFLTPHELSAHG